MARIEKRPFKVLEVDQNLGCITVQFINKYGPVETGEISEDDCYEIVRMGTGDYTSKGVEIIEEKKIPKSNPNEDLILNVNIPVDSETGKFKSSDYVLEHIAQHYPEDTFLDMKRRKEAPPEKDLDDLIGKDFVINLHFQDPVQYEDFSVSKVEDL